MFDPGQLGALTPTYATVEMFDGQDPDPRDDIYALGIITYQLLTGEHPYGKKSAPKAMQLGLVPAPVASLDKRQNRGLRRSLAFLREERTPTVAEFLADLRPRKSRVVPIAISIVVTLLVVAALAWKPVQDYLRKQENDEIIAVFMRGDEASINAGLARVEALPDPTQRQEIAEDPRTRDAIIGLYVQRRREHFDPAAGRYDYAAGERQMELLAQLYPDSAEVLRTRNEYRAERDRLLAQLDTRLRDLLRQGRLLPDADGEDVADLLDIVHSVDPESPLLHDAGVAAAYVAAAGEASAAGDWRRALELLETGDALSPGDEKLAVALTEVRAELERQGKAARVQALRERWQPRLSTLGEASALDAAEAELTELQELAPSEALFTQLEPIVDPLLEQRVTTLLAAGDAAAARELLERQGRFASVAMLETLRARLGAASAPRGDAVAAGATLDEWLAREPDDAGRWSGGLATALKILLSRTSAGDPQAVTRQAAVAERVQTLSRAALDAERFEESARWLALGERLAPTDAQRWQATRESLAAARTAASERAAAAARAKRLADLRERVQTLAAAGDGRAAREALAAYAREAGETDEYTREGGPRAVAGAYLAMADAAAGAEEALVVVREGLEVAPHETTLREREQALAARVLERALTLAVRTQPTPTTAPTAAGAVRAAPAAALDDGVSTVDAVRGHPPAYPALGGSLLSRVAAAYVAAAGEASAAGDWRRALELLETGDALSPGDEKLAVALTEVRAELERQGKAARVQALRERWQPRLSTLGEASALDAAEAELTELQELAPSEALFTQLEPIVDPLLEQRVTTLLAAGDAAAARELLERQGRFASVAMLETLRARLGAASAPRGDAVAAGATLDEWLAREPDDAGRWSGGLATALKILLSRTSAGDPQAVTRQAAVAERVQTLSRAALDAERFEESARWLALGERLAPTDAQRWQATRESLAAARTAASERAAAAARAKRLADLRERVQTLAAAGDGRAAREALAAYAREAGETDEYTREGGPRAVAGAYLAMADAAAGAEEALVVVREGLEVAPHETTLREREQALAARVLERALTLAVRTQPTPTTAPTAAGAVRAAPAAALDDGVSTVDAVRGHPPAYPALGDNGARDARDMLAKQAALTRDLAAVRIALADYDQLYPQAGDAAREQVGSALARAIAENTRANRGGLDKLRQTVADFRTLFPAQWSTLREAAGSRLRREIEKMQGDDLPRAHNLLALAREVLPGSSALDQARLKALPKPSRYAPTVLNQISAGKLSAAQQTFAKMIAEEPDHEQVPVVRAALDKRLAEASEKVSRI